MNGDVENMTGSSHNGREFFQCWRCQRFITSGTSTAKRIHNVKCLSEAFAARSSRGNDSQLFQGYTAKRFHPAQVNVTKLSAKEIESIQEKLKVEMRQPRKSYLKARAMLQEFTNSSDTKSVGEEEKEKKSDRRERRRNKVVGKLGEQQKSNNVSEIGKKKRIRAKKWSSCEICQKQIKLKELIDHRREFHNIILDQDKFGTVGCKVCGKRLRDHHLKPHLEFHAKLEEKAKNSKLNCIVCNNGFSHCASLKKHFVGHHMENSPFDCKFPGCKIVTGDYFHLERHVAIHMFGNQFKCSDCGEHLSRYDKLQKHKRICRGRRKASSADIVIESASIMRNSNEQRNEHCKIESVHLIDRIIETVNGPVHIKGENLEPIPESVILGNNDNDTKPITKTEMNDMHMQQGPGSTVQDTLLSWNPKIKSSSYLNALIREDPLFQKLEKEHPEFTKLILRGNRLNDYKLPKDGKAKRFRCDYCGATFRRSWALRKHNMQDVCGLKAGGNDTHAQLSNNETQIMPTVINGDNPSNAVINLLCLGCGYQSTSSEDLKIHLETAPVHQDTWLENNTHHCLKCGQWFKTAKTLNTHTSNIHVAKKDFKCEACSKAFTTKQRQMAHYNRYCRRNPKDSLYSCSHCNRTFRVLENFQNHEKKCEKNETRPKCAQCGDDFGNKTALRRHVIVVHANQSMQQRKGASVSTSGDISTSGEVNGSMHNGDMILGF